MKYHCNSCKLDFTTMAADKKTKEAFTLYFNNMKCPHCGASIHSIELHEDCRGKVIFTCGEPTGVECGNCYSFFNCWTGNIDEGFVPEKVDDRTEKAIKRVEELKKEETKNKIFDAYRKLTKKGIEISQKNGFIYLKVIVTTYKMASKDVKSMMNSKWDTPMTKAAAHSLSKHGINTEEVTTLLNLVRGSEVCK